MKKTLFAITNGVDWYLNNHETGRVFESAGIMYFEAKDKAQAMIDIHPLMVAGGFAVKEMECEIPA